MRSFLLVEWKSNDHAARILYALAEHVYLHRLGRSGAVQPTAPCDVADDGLTLDQLEPVDLEQGQLPKL